MLNLVVGCFKLAQWKQIFLKTSIFSGEVRKIPVAYHKISVFGLVLPLLKGV